ncbi:MAG: Gfo/Idh/MocA family oxidoreductase [Parabacteroides sp.]|nr:Gfo/Idh/MocA family oxidoreductase [Massilibacteroides sp.]MDD4406356.1 Gfo/Idh/MocA family oxidoreductase [Parabacteroides sp.]
MSKLKVGIIGCGGISNNKHMPAIKKAGYAEIVAFCDIIEERAVKSAKEFGNEEAKVFIDYKELLKEDLDAVYVCTPNRSHAMISVDALHSGKHVMCEKPMALNYEEACLMVNAAKETGKILTIGYQNRYRADSQYLKQECEDGALGEIYYAKAKAIRRRAVPTWGVFLNEYEQGGGPLIDIGTHALDLTLWTMGNYKPKYAVGTTYHKLNQDTDQGNAFGPWKSDEFTVEDSAFGFVVMDNGATITLEASWALNTLDVLEASTVLCGTKAGADMQDGLRINGIKHDKQYVTKPDLAAGGVAFFEGTSASPDVVEQIVFGKAILGEGELTVLPEQAAVVTRILDAIYESAKTGKPVYFE